MRFRFRGAGILFFYSAICLALNPSVSFADEYDDYLKEARKASCQELSDVYKELRADEEKIAASIKGEKNKTIATNAVGVASVALLGVGFFTWNDDESAEENLDALRKDIEVVKKAAGENKCKLAEPAKPKDAPKKK